MVSRVGVSEDFRKQVLGYGLTTAQILYRMPDHPSLLQTYVWQNYDLFPKFPALKDFLSFWEKVAGWTVVLRDGRPFQADQARRTARRRRRVPAALNSARAGKGALAPCPPRHRTVLTFPHRTERENVDGQEEADIAGRGPDRRTEKIAGAQKRRQQDRRQIHIAKNH